jgi:hypothetical protein
MLVTSMLGYVPKSFPGLTELQRDKVGQFLHELMIPTTSTASGDREKKRGSACGRPPHLFLGICLRCCREAAP